MLSCLMTVIKVQIAHVSLCKFGLADYEPLGFNVNDQAPTLAQKTAKVNYCLKLLQMLAFGLGT